MRQTLFAKTCINTTIHLAEWYTYMLNIKLLSQALLKQIAACSLTPWKPFPLVILFLLLFQLYTTAEGNNLAKMIL